MTASGSRSAAAGSRSATVRRLTRPTVIAVLVAAALAALSLLLIEPAPSYDPWAWLLWGREVAHGTLSTTEGPAFKPLPVAVCALLSPLGGAAPETWVWLVRVAALLAVWLAYRLGRRLAGGSQRAGVLAGAGVGLCAGFPGLAAAGSSEGPLIALALAAVAAWDRPRLALACGIGCALLRVEAWPFLLAAGVLLWRRRPQDRALLVATALLVPAAWFVPEWLGSGDLLRSGARARIPNPGQPALAAVPALASLEEAAKLALWPLWLGALALATATPRAQRSGAQGAGRGAGRGGAQGTDRGAGRGGAQGTDRGAGRGGAQGAGRAAAWNAWLPLAPAAAGLAWVLLVAAMAQAGFSGEPRYALPGMALVGISGAVGLERLRAPRWLPALAAAAVAVAVVARLADLPDLRARQAYQARLSNDLRAAVHAAGGRRGVLACGRPYVGNFRGPLMAYRLDVQKRAVAFDPHAPGVIFRSRLRTGAPLEPAVPRGFVRAATEGGVEVLATCRLRVP